MPTAGSALRRQLDAALRREAERLGQPLQWDEAERHAVDSAVRCVDNRARLQRLLAAELRRGTSPENSGEGVRPSTVARLSAEIRLLDVAAAHHLRSLRIDGLVPPSAQHVAANRARWGAPRPKRRVG